VWEDSSSYVAWKLHFPVFEYPKFKLIIPVESQRKISVGGPYDIKKLFTSVRIPIVQADTIVVFFNGDRSNALLPSESTLLLCINGHISAVEIVGICVCMWVQLVWFVKTGYTYRGVWNCVQSSLVCDWNSTFTKNSGCEDFERWADLLCSWVCPYMATCNYIHGKWNHALPLYILHTPTHTHAHTHTHYYPI